MLMSDAEHGPAARSRRLPGLQGGPHNHTTAAIAVALGEALEPQFADYARQTVANAKALAAALSERGFDLVSGGTDNHLILIDLTNKGVPGKPAAQALDRARITTNYNTVPFDPRKPFDPSGIRIGTPAVTTRGMGESEMERIAAGSTRGSMPRGGRTRRRSSESPMRFANWHSNSRSRAQSFSERLPSQETRLRDLLSTAEGEGFEPPGRSRRPTVFKTVAFVRSATPPVTSH